MNRRIVRVVSWVLVLTSLLFASMAVANTGEPAAQVVAVSGDVKALGDEGVRALRRRSEIYVGESVMTGPKARAQLRFSDGALVSLDSGSEVVINAYHHNKAKPEESRALLNLVTGGLRSITGAIADEYPEGYEVQTPLASIGVRGTDFQLMLEQSRLTVGVWDGAVSIKNEAGELEIGVRLPFRFAVIESRATPPRGVLEAPAELAPDYEKPEVEKELSAETDASDPEPASETGIQEDAAAVETQEAGGAPLADSSAPAQQSLAENTVTTDQQPEPEPTPPVEEEPAPQPPAEEEPVAPAPEPALIDPDMPGWFVPKQDRLNAMFFTWSSNFVNEQNEPSSWIGMNVKPADAPVDGNGFTLSWHDFETQDFGYIFQGWSPSDANKVPNFPVYWGTWDGSSEILEFFSGSPNADGTYDLDSYDVYPTTREFTSAAWAYSAVDPASLADITQALPGTTEVTYGSGVGFESGIVLASQFSDGVFDPSRSEISFDLDLNTGTVIEYSGGYQFVVVGDGFDQVWTSTSGAAGSNWGTDLSGDLPQLGFSYYNGTVTNSDGSLVDASGPGTSVGFLIQSDWDPAEGGDTIFGFFGGIDLSARDADGNILSEGYVNFALSPFAPSFIHPDLPDWFTPKQDRLNATLFTQAYNFVNEQNEPSSWLGTAVRRSDAPADGNGITLSEHDFATQDFGYIFQDWPASQANKAPGFPVYWGSWNGSSEILEFFSGSPNADGTYDLDSYNVYPTTNEYTDAAWAYSTVEPLTLADINQVLPGTSAVTFGSGAGFGSGIVLASQFSDGVFDPARSSISFDLDLNTGTVIEYSGGYELVVAGNGFDQIWASTVGASDFASNLSGGFPQLGFSYINSTVTNSDGSLSADPPAGGITSGFIIPSDVNPSQLGFLGGITLSARDADGNKLSEGYVNFILNAQ